MNIVKKFTQGMDSNTFKGVGYLLWLNIKKQIALWVFVGIIVILALLATTGTIQNYNRETWSTAIQAQFSVRVIIVSGTLIPLLFVTLFSIPSTLNSIHKTTLIKRIGSTRLTEESFILIITIWYTIISVAILSSLFFGIIIISRVQAPPELELLRNIFKAYIFALFLTILLVTMGVMLGNMPVSQILVTVLTTVLFIASLLFGGFILPLTNGIGILIPSTTRILVILNPIGFSSYSMASILTDGYTWVSAISSIVYMISLSLLFFCVSATIMNFNKIK